MNALTSDFRIAHDSDFSQRKKELERFLYERVYRHPHLVEIRKRAQDRLKLMYQGYCERPEHIPQHHRVRIKNTGLCRTTVEYIAGMTDKFCEDIFNRHFAVQKG